jgi:hypothetical protein
MTSLADIMALRGVCIEESIAVKDDIKQILDQIDASKDSSKVKESLEAELIIFKQKNVCLIKLREKIKKTVATILANSLRELK